MKLIQLLILLLFNVFYASGQDTISIEMQYINECYADSVVVGYKFIYSEQFDTCGHMEWQTYSTFYTLLSHPEYDYEKDWPENFHNISTGVRLRPWWSYVRLPHEISNPTPPAEMTPSLSGSNAATPPMQNP